MKEFEQYNVFPDVLNAFSKLQCNNKCYKGPKSVAGCASNCTIRQCCIEHKLEGCFQCDDYHDCEKLKGMQEMHPDIIYNLDIIKEKGLSEWVDKRGKHYKFYMGTGQV